MDNETWTDRDGLIDEPTDGLSNNYVPTFGGLNVTGVCYINIEHSMHTNLGQPTNKWSTE